MAVTVGQKEADHGTALLKQAQEHNFAGRYDEALVLYDQLLTQNPKHPALLGEVATVHLRNPQAVGHAIMMLERSCELYASDGQKTPPEIKSNLGLAYKHAGLMKKAEAVMKDICETAPTPGSLSNYGSMFVETDRAAKGIEILEKAISMDPSLAMAHWNLSLCLLSQCNETGGWGRAWDEYEYGQHDGGMRVRKKLVKLPDWDGSKGKKVIVYGEQGIGDEIMFASMLPDLIRDIGRENVILDCHARLTTIFEKSFGVRCYGTRKNPELDWLDVEKPDAMIAIGSLGKFYRRNSKDFPGEPYLYASPLLPKSRKLRVGISWTGGRLKQRIARRTVPLSWWKQILANDVEVVSLQYTKEAPEEIKAYEAQFKREITDYSKITYEVNTSDYYETARLAASCDLIITVCTSMVHLAGALGVPCWVMVPRSPAWRYQNSGPMPWYKSVRLYRQAQNGDEHWIPVIERVDQDLAALVKEFEKRERKAA